MQQKRLRNIFACLLALVLAAALIGCSSAAIPTSPTTTDETAETQSEPEAPTKADDIVIIFTNDVHAGIDEDIGFAGLAAYKKSLEEKHDKVLLVDVGDQVQGAYISVISKGEYIIDLMNHVGYDYAALGNHEFDYGMEQLAANMASFNGKYLCCNMTYSGTGKNVIESALPYDIVEFGQKKVALVGISTPNTIFESSPMVFKEDGEMVYSFAGGKNGQELYDVVQETVDECRKNGADYVVVLGHLGVEEQAEPFCSYNVIENTCGIDVFLDAHSHTEIPERIVLNKEGKEVLLSSTGTKLNNIGVLTISQAGTIVTTYIDDYPLRDPEVTAVIESYNDLLSEQMNQVIGKCSKGLSISDANGIRMIRTRQMPIGDFVADAYRFICEADIGMCNGGGIRDDIREGDVTYGNLIAVSPYGNMLCVVKVKGAELLDMLEYFYSSVQSEYVVDGSPYGENGSFMQVSGLKLTVDTSIETSIEVDAEDALIGVGEIRRVKDVQVLKDGEYVPIDPEETYTIAGQDYMIKNGGCGMGVMMADNELVVDSAIADYQALIDYMNSEPDIFSKYAQTDERIFIE